MAKKNARNTRGRIVSAAWQLFYEQGYEHTTVEEIIDQSQTSKGSFYHYFDGDHGPRHDCNGTAPFSQQ